MSSPHAAPWTPIPPPPPTRRTADRALLLGVLSLPFSLLAGVPAVALGVRALRVAHQVGGRGRAWAGIVLGSVMTIAAVVGFGLLGVRVVDGLRDAAVPGGSARAQERDAERATADDAALVRAVGVPLAQLRRIPGVVLRHDPGASVDCLDSCSEAELAVTGAAAETGALSRATLLERLRAQGYRDAFAGGDGCPPLDPARPCRLTAPDGRGSLQLSSEPGSSGYVLRVNGP